MRKRLIGVLAAGIVLGVCAEARAAFDFSATPRRGGQHIRFEEAQPGGLLRNEELTLTVDTDLGAQYRILQTLYQPLTNEQGRTLPSGAWIQFSPSEPLGTLRPKLETPVQLGQHQIYTSNTQGESDSFILVFNVRVPEDQPGGVYRTQISFTAEPVTPVSGVTSRVLTLDVRVELQPTFRMTILSAGGGRTLDLGSIDRDRATAEGALNVGVENNTGHSYRLVQQLVEPLTSETGEILDEDQLTVRPQEVRSGRVSAAAAEPVALSPKILYESDATGSSEELVLVYGAGTARPVPAGRYRGMLQLRAESASPYVSADPVPVPVQLRVDEVLDLQIELDPQGGLQFGRFGAGGTQSRTVTLSVVSNLGKPYQISQLVGRKLTNEKGVSIAQDQFTYSVQALSSGLPARPSEPVAEGESSIFTSDRAGTPEKLLVRYDLTVPPGAHSGSYTSEIKYSLTTI
ncbi:MAG: hypothetical protein MOGMAGMI_01494 [Candidatus Omnitrophica bacterium]|nr:hypothetical protein [Candidatus Omnitrophota bacterium]